MEWRKVQSEHECVPQLRPQLSISTGPASQGETIAANIYPENQVIPPDTMAEEP